MNVLCDDGCALDEALVLAARIVANAPVAVRESLRVLEGTARAEEELGWALTEDAKAAVFASEDAREGRDAFLGKRAPVWKGK